MKTWKTKLSVCRSRKSGKFSAKGKCKAFKKSKVKVGFFGSLFK